MGHWTGLGRAGLGQYCFQNVMGRAETGRHFRETGGPGRAEPNKLEKNHGQGRVAAHTLKNRWAGSDRCPM